MSIHILVIDL
jgi:hypothetical protein